MDNRELMDGVFRKDVIEEMVEGGYNKSKLMKMADDGLAVIYDIFRRHNKLEAN